MQYQSRKLEENMHPEAKKELRARFKFVVLDYAKYPEVAEACREFEVPRSSFYN